MDRHIPILAQLSRVILITSLTTRPTPQLCGRFVDKLILLIEFIFMFYFACVFFFIANRLRRITATQFLNAFYFILK
jgi:hypothetical protein